MIGLLRRYFKSLCRMETVLKENNQVVVSIMRIRGRKFLKKKFKDTEVGSTYFAREMLADELFQCYKWNSPVIEEGPLWIVRPYYPEKCRLDIVVPDLPQLARNEIAKEVISIIFDIFCAGYVHRNIHARNLYRVGKLLTLTGFERLKAYPGGGAVAFPLSYDIRGKAVEVPESTRDMFYTSDAPLSLQSTLGVPVEVAIKEFEGELKSRIRQVCSTFATVNKRHVCRLGRIYSSFELPYLSVSTKDAQRNSKVRLENFGISEEGVCGKKVLDLGCNIGGIIFEIQKYKPSTSIGIEYDIDKVILATQIARYNGLENVKFIQADIDYLNAESMGEPFDIVFCLAVEAHVNKPRRLFRLLSQVTKGVLYFEGNSKCDTQMVERALIREGFVDVEHLGFGNDDCRPSNNNRPMIRARKS